MKKTLELTKSTLLIVVILLVGAAWPPSSLAQGLPGSTSTYSTLIDINFGAHQSPGLDANKVGLAATGLTVGDFWNFYSRDDGQGHWLVNGVLPNLRFTDGSASSAGLIVSNAPGCWADGSSDAMYNTYIYPFDGGNTTVMVTNLAAGQYDLYVYGPNGTYQLTAGGTSYGPRTSFDWPVINPTVWQEGRQYAAYRGVLVGAGQVVKVTVLPNACGSLAISGMQIGSMAGVTEIAPSIVTQPQSQTAVAGSSATFAVAAGGTPPLGYQWRFNGTNIAGATATALVLANVQPAQAGSYSVRITNLYGSATSSNAVLTVNPAGSCVPPPAGLVSWWRTEANALDQAGTNTGTLVGNTTYGLGRVGQAFVFDGRGDAVSVGNPINLQLQNFTIEAWIKRANSSLASFGGEGAGHIFGGSYGGYVFGLWDDGQLTLGQIGISGVESVRAITDTNSFHHVAVTKNGSNIVFYVDGAGETAAAYNPGFVFGGGFAIGARGGDYGASFLGALDEVSIYNRALSAAEIQAIYLANGAGKCAAGVAPSITAEPAGQTVVAGSTVTFTVTATGTPPLSYQWRFNGTNISAATATALTLTNVQSAQAGTYSVRTTNLYGSATSSNAVLTVNPAGSCVPSPAGLVSWWRGEGNSLDAVGANNGTLENGVTFGVGRVGQAFSFDGQTGSVLVPDSASLRLTNQLTIEAWVNTRSTNKDRTVVSKVGGVGGNNGYQLAFSGSMLLGQFNRPGQAWPGYRVSYPTLVTLGAWNHVAWTYDQSVMKLYWNGVPVATNAVGAQAIAVSSSNLRIGDDDNHNTPFDGLIDEPSVYSRALSASEIAAIYNAGSAGKCAAGAAPSIIAQPASQTVLAGSTATFSVTVAGTPPLSYQWRFNGTNILGATATAFTLTNVQPAQAGSYTVRITNLYGSATSSNAVLTVNPAVTCAPPPSGMVGWWRSEGNALDSSGTNSGVLHNGVGFANGEVGQTFSFNDTDSYVEVPDSSALRLTNQITIEAWINARTANGPYGNALVSKVGGLGGNNGYQFFLDGNTLVGQFNSPGEDWPSARVTSGGIIATGVWYHVAWTYDQAAMKLYCNGQPVATNVIGAMSIAASSSNLRLSGDDNDHVYFDGLIDEASVYNRALSGAEIAAIYNAGSAGKCAAGTAPSITVQPASQAVGVGTNVTFMVAASGTAPLSYQWRFNGTNILAATATALTLTNVQPAQSGSYTVRITNLYGSATSSSAMLTVNPASACTPPPSGMVSWWRGEGNALDQVGGNNGVLVNGVDFDAGIVGHAFRFNGSSNSFVEVADSPSLRFTNAMTIECWAKRLNTSEVHVLVEKGGDWTSGQSDFEVALNDTYAGGKHFGFSFAGGWRGCAVTPDTAWHHYAAVAVSGQADPILYIDGVQKTITYRGGAATMNLTGSPCPLHLGAHLDPQTGWFNYSSTMIDEPAFFDRALSTSEVQAIYSAGSAGKCIGPTAPFITSQPTNQMVSLGGTATFTVVAGGKAPLSYQWRLGGTNLAGATRSALALENVQPANAGSYSVRVTNAFGSVFSSNATLTVIQGAPNTLINVDFGAGPATSVSQKAGPAAVGQGTNDFWNFYTRDDDSGEWRAFGVVSSLKFANGAVSTSGMTVLNAPGAWADGSSDPMYNSYVYPFDGANVTVTVTNLAAGQYDFYVYGPDGNYQLAVGPAVYGVKTTLDQPLINPTSWQEGRQYATYRGVSVGAGQGVILTVRPGVYGYAVISGMQIVSPVAAGQPQRPTAQLKLASARSTSGGFPVQLEFLGDPNRVYVFQASTTLAEWVTICFCVTDANASVTLTDPDAGKYRARFYRVVAQ
jgi:hypothetical protein